MKTTFRIEIEIENEIGDVKITTRAYDIIFTEYNNLFNPAKILDSYKVAMKHAGDFKMITMYVCSNPELYFNDKKFYREIRFVKDSTGVITISTCKNNRFEVWNPATKKDIVTNLIELTEIGNREYITVLKQNAV